MCKRSIFINKNVSFVWFVLVSCNFCSVEECWPYQLTQTVKGVLLHLNIIYNLFNIFKVSLFTSDTFLALFCLLHVPLILSLSLSLPSFFLFSFFSFCFCVIVEMTSVVELFSDQFSFSIKSGTWTDQCCCMQCMFWGLFIFWVVFWFCVCVCFCSHSEI